MYQLNQITNKSQFVRNSINRSPWRRGLPRKQQLPRTQALSIIRGLHLTALALVVGWLALSPQARAGCQDGCALGINNTFLGDNALTFNTTGTANTAIGAFALESNTTGSSNTATGLSALFSNTTGANNTANGINALTSNQTGNNNTANGISALSFNSSGGDNTANGTNALQANTIGGNNTANGVNALSHNTTGNSNIALGVSAGTNLTTGSNNIDIAALGAGGESNTIRIGKFGVQKNTFVIGISGSTVPGGVNVIIDSLGHLGTINSSARYKEAIQPMDKASEAILSLQPVSFRYKHELDPAGIPQFGLVAEQVEKVSPDLVARDEQGKPYTVRYEAVNAMLLNEFLKEHRKVEKQDATIVELQSQIRALGARLDKQAAQIRKVSAPVQLTEGASRVDARSPNL